MSKSAAVATAADTAARVRRIRNGTLANVLAQVINTAGQLATVPLLSAVWGTQLYGEWLTLSAAAAYVGLVDFGLQTYVINVLTKAWALNDVDHFKVVYRSALAFALATGTFGMVVAVAAASFLPLHVWLRFQSISPATVIAVTAILACNVVLYVPYGIVNGVYRSVGEYARGQMITNVRSLAAFAALTAVVLAGGNLVWAATSQLLITAISFVYVYRDLRSRYPEIIRHTPKPDFRVATSFIGPSLYFFALQMMILLGIQGSTLAVGALYGAVGVALFVTLRTLGNIIKQVITTVYNALWPELTAMNARGERNTLAAVHQIGAKLSLMMAVTLAAILHFRGEVIVAAWTGGAIPFNLAVMDALLVCVLVECLWLGSSLVLSSSNCHKPLAWFVSASKIAGLACGVWLALRFDLPAFIYGLAASEAILCAGPVIRRACQVTGQDFWSYLADVLVRGFPAVVVTLAAGLSLAAVTPAGIVYVPVYATLVAAVAAAATYAAWLRPQERRYVHQVSNAVLRRQAA